MYYERAAAVFFGVLALILLADMVYRAYRQDRDNRGDALRAEIRADTSVSANDRYLLLLQAEAASAARAGWLERSFSTLGTVALIAALVTAGVQTAQSADLRAEGERATREVALLRSQAGRAEALVTPLSKVIIEDFEARGVTLDGGARDLVMYQLDRWVADEKADPTTLLRAFKASAIIGDFAAANAIANRLGTDLSAVNPAERRGATQYLYTAGFGAQAFDRLQPILASPATIARSDLIFIYALARIVDAVPESEAVNQVARGLGVSPQVAAAKLGEAATRLRRNRERFIEAARSDRPD